MRFGPSPATRVYLGIARAAASVLGRDELVETVLVRRSVAAGEVVFGRSDIDLAMVLRDRPADGSALLSLVNRYRMLRAACPLIGECLVYNQLDLRTWWRTDTYRASLDRRAASTLYGPPVSVPALPVRREHAAHRCAFWLDGYLPRAFLSGNLRNLRKLAVEMWNAYATAAGILSEPVVRRSEAERLWRAHDGDAASRLRSSGPRGLMSLCFGILKQLHDRMLPPARAPLRPLVLLLRWPPGHELRTLVLIPHGASDLPAEAIRPGALIFTPEALGLYLEFVNPFAVQAFPPQVWSVEASAGAWLRASRSYGASFRTRSPGFEKQSTILACGRLLSVEHALESPGKGERPSALPSALVDRILATPKSIERYYRDVYAGLDARCAELWRTIEGIEELTSSVSAASSFSAIRAQS